MMREENLVERIRHEMQQRGWSQERMSKEITDAGYPIHQTSIGKIVSPGDGMRRTISADEAIGFAKVFGISLEESLLPIDDVQRIRSEITALAQDRDEIDRRMDELNEQLIDAMRKQEARAA